MAEQTVLYASEAYEELDSYFKQNQVHSVLLVCGLSIQKLKLNSYFSHLEERIGIKVFRFSDFQVNPLYEDMCKGVDFIEQNACDCIIAVGGGSAIDVAKCISFYSGCRKNGGGLIAIPTTAGSGSEATRYAVVYKNGEKQSVTDEKIMPDVVLFDDTVLQTLPPYQKKSTMLDALCHAVESYWSVNSNTKSREYAKDAINTILPRIDNYLEGDRRTFKGMLMAANNAGKAINITQTTAGHAMCYKLTSLYGIAHGHAVALCVKELWQQMVQGNVDCVDVRGQEHLQEILKELSKLFGGTGMKDGAKLFGEMLDRLELAMPERVTEDVELLAKSVNADRMKNHPVRLDEILLQKLYRNILKK